VSNRLAAVGTLAYAVAADVLVSLNLPAVVAVVCLTPLVLFAPGYACVLAFDLSAERRLPGRRFVLALAMSMGCVVLGGLVLNALGPLDQVSWSEWLVGVTCVFAIGALARDLYDGRTFAVSRPATLRPRGTVLSLPLAGAAAVAILALGTAVTLTETSGHRAYDKPVTQLSLLPVGGSPGQSLRLAVTNLSSRAEHVTLTIARGAGPAKAMAVVVPATSTWSRIEPSGLGAVRATLTRPGEKQAFSEVSWGTAR
jgi:hypothetical protein